MVVTKKYLVMKDINSRSLSIEQNSIGHTQIIISQDFKRIPEGLTFYHKLAEIRT
jgi:hypothetical protein